MSAVLKTLAASYTIDRFVTANGPDPYFQGNALLVGGGVVLLRSGRRMPEKEEHK